MFSKNDSDNIFNILKSPGSTMVYSNYVEMEGLQIFKVYLQFFGYAQFNPSIWFY